MIGIKDLSFSYGKLKLFENFNLEVPEGEVCLITGINGVGKSTLLRLIAGALHPAGGDILFDEKIGRDPRRKIGFISDILSLYESLTVARSIDFHMSVYNLSKYDNSLIRHTKIGLDQKIKDLSTGQKTIFHLSLILSTEPEILLIDEIIHSIDAYLRRLFLEQLIQLQSERKLTILMVNLNFHDIEHIVERVILLKSGTIAVDEKIDDLKAKVKKNHLSNATPNRSCSIPDRLLRPLRILRLSLSRQAQRQNRGRGCGPEPDRYSRRFYRRRVCLKKRFSIH